MLHAETPDMNNNQEILACSADFLKGKKIRRGKMNVAMEENVGQTKGFERALEGLGSEPTQGTIPPS